MNVLPCHQTPVAFKEQQRVALLLLDNAASMTAGNKCLKKRLA